MGKRARVVATVWISIALGLQLAAGLRCFPERDSPWPFLNYWMFSERYRVGDTATADRVRLIRADGAQDELDPIRVPAARPLGVALRAGDGAAIERWCAEHAPEVRAVELFDASYELTPQGFRALPLRRVERYVRR